MERLAGLDTGQATGSVAWVLAAACRSARTAIKDMGQSSSSGQQAGKAAPAGAASLITPAQSRALQALPADGAMRPAVSALLESCDPGELLPQGYAITTVM